MKIDYKVRYQLSKASLQEMGVSIAAVLETNIELLDILSSQLSGEKLPAHTSDYTSDMVVLEETLKKSVPDSLVLLNLEPHYLAETAVVRDMQDMRVQILQLVSALPTS